MSDHLGTLAPARDLRALGRFELFLGTAIATVLIVRSALAVSGYPQVGGGGLHIAHVLWGGLLMGVAIVMVQIVPGTRARSQAAFIGGIGFGLFIDEVGKFLTKDVNYFFRPAVAIIYAVFVAFYIVVRELLMHRPLTDERRLAIAASATSDLALRQLDSAGRAHALGLIEGLEQSPLVEGIRGCLTSATVEDDKTWLTHVRDRLHGLAASAVSHRVFVPGLQVLFALQFTGMIGQLLLVVLRPGLGLGNGNHVTDLGTEASTALSALLAVVGLIRMQRDDVAGALRMLYRSTLVTLLLTQLFVFVRYQWSGLLGFAAQAVVLYALRLAINADAHRTAPVRT